MIVFCYDYVLVLFFFRGPKWRRASKQFDRFIRSFASNISSLKISEEGRHLMDGRVQLPSKSPCPYVRDLLLIFWHHFEAQVCGSTVVGGEVSIVTKGVCKLNLKFHKSLWKNPWDLADVQCITATFSKAVSGSGVVLSSTQDEQFPQQTTFLFHVFLLARQLSGQLYTFKERRKTVKLIEKLYFSLCKVFQKKSLDRLNIR